MKTCNDPFEFCLSHILGVRNPSVSLTIEHTDREGVTTSAFAFTVKPALYSDPENVLCDGDSEYPEWEALTFFCYDKRGAKRRGMEAANKWLDSVGITSPESRMILTREMRTMDSVVYIPLSEIRDALEVAA